MNFNGTLESRNGLCLAFEERSKSFAAKAIPTAGFNRMHVSFQHVKNGRVLALYRNRRSGAQRGASENNFGQRFSVSTPCFSRSRMALPLVLGHELSHQVKFTRILGQRH